MGTVKRIHSYNDHDDNPVKELLEFGLTRIELGKNLHLRKEFEEMQKVTKEDPRELEDHEVRRMIMLIEALMKLTYGVRGGPDNRRLIKNEDVWLNFAESNAYDSFVFWLFQDTERANDFMEALMPPELREAAAELNLEQADPNAPIAPAEIPDEELETPAKKVPLKKKRDVPSHEELLQMFHDKQNGN